MQAILSIALGGALGAVARHFLNGAVTAGAGDGFPWGIMAVNILGSFLMGVLVALFARFDPVPVPVKLFLTVGLMGGFTTFSAFSLDVIMLAERGAVGAAAFYGAASVGLAVAGLYAGMILTRMLVA